MKKFILKWIYRITAINNRKVLLRVANLPANGTVRITKDEEKLLKDMIKYTLNVPKSVHGFPIARSDL